MWTSEFFCGGEAADSTQTRGLENEPRHPSAPPAPGAWACAAVKLLARNAREDDPGDRFEDEVRMWVYEEEVEGRCAVLHP